jgi:hypothetical protein
MDFFARHPALRRSVALILATIFSAGCVTWRTLPTPQGYLTAQRPSRARVYLTAGQQMNLYSPAVVGSDLIAYRQKGVDSSRVVIPLRDVRRVDVREANEEGTGWLIVAGVVVGVVAYAALTMKGTLMGGGGFGCGWCR